MHQKYAREGLACVSVSVDDPAMPAMIKAAEGFLLQQKATFANYLLMEEVDVWQERMDLSAPPAVFIFDREGRRAAKFDTSDPDKPFTYEDVEKVVKRLLKTSEP